MDKLKFGIEKAIVGFFWLTFLVFIYIRIGHPCWYPYYKFIQESKFGSYLPYFAIGLATLSYLFGTIMDATTYFILGPFLKIYLKKKKEKFLPQPEYYFKMVKLFNEAAPELRSEYNYKRGQAMVFRVFGSALLFNAPAMLIGLKRSMINIIIAGSVFVIGILILWLFFSIYLDYHKFRSAAFKYIEKATGPGRTPPGPEEI
jgi:uncharacterized Tic20 family protein